MQRPASIEDQPRSCREFAERNGWQILENHIYKDAALSCATKNHRTGLKALEIAAETRPRPFDYILFDDTSRLGRDQAFGGLRVAFCAERKLISIALNVLESGQPPSHWRLVEADDRVDAASQRS